MDAATAMFAGGGSSSTALAASGPLGGFGASSAAGGGLMLAGEGMSLGRHGEHGKHGDPWRRLGAGGLTVAQGLMKLGASRQEAAMMEEQALWGDFNARQEILRGRQVVIEQKRQMGKIVASNIASGFASGFRGGGSITQASKDVIAEAEFQMDMTRMNSEMQAGQIKAQAGQTRKQASMTRQGGLFDALTPVTELGIASYARGDIG
jgi:hypothetical protein